VDEGRADERLRFKKKVVIQRAGKQGRMLGEKKKGGGKKGGRYNLSCAVPRLPNGTYWHAFSKGCIRSAENRSAEINTNPKRRAGITRRDVMPQILEGTRGGRRAREKRETIARRG